jgi:MFS family permease
MATSTDVRLRVEEHPFSWRFTFPLLLGATLNPINSSMIATGLAGIATDFHTGPGQTAGLVSVLYLCSAVMQPTMGKLATIFGPRRVFLAGILILLLGGVVGALAPSFGFLLLSRVLIGAGTSAGYPTAMALVRSRADRLGVGVPSQVLGNFSIASQITVVFGLPIGGVLAGVFGWRSLFLVNVPLALLTLAFAFFGLDENDHVRAERRGHVLTEIDLPGILQFASAIISLLLFLANLAHPVWGLFAVALLLIVTLIVWEQRTLNPLINVRTLAQNSPLQRTYLRQTLVGLGIYTSLYGSSQWMEQSAGFSSFAVGLILLPLSGLSIVLARINSNRGWVRWPLILGAVALFFAGGIMLAITSASGVLILIGMSLLFGCTNGFSGFANQAALYVQAPAETIAIASGLYRTFAYIGAIFSASLISLTFGTTVTDEGFHRLGWVTVGIGVLATLITLFDQSIPLLAKPAQTVSSSSHAST